MKFQPRKKSQIFHIIDVFSYPDENLIQRTRQFLVYFQKKMATSQARFRWTKDKLINLKCLQEFKNSMEFRNCNQTLTKSNYMKVGEKVYIDLKKSKKTKGFWFTLL